MEEQKLRMKPALKQQMNVQRIKFVVVWYSLKSVVLNLLQGRNNTNVQRIINWTTVNWFGAKKIFILKQKRINIIAKIIYKIMVIES